MEAIGRQLRGRYIVPDMSSGSALDQQVSDETVELLLRPHDVLALVEQARHFTAVVLVSTKRVTLENCLEASNHFALLFSDRRQLLEMSCNLTFVPRVQDRFDV